ncbi:MULTISPECIES: hypothetical protein [unclassified Microcoleus]|uniref:hypothetical protein n=1 Tax=unclassified Microcoleus TaxID=2642155 RepID=UPI002FCF7605
MALHGLRSLLGVLQNRFQITELGIGNLELVSCPAFLKPLPVSPSPHLPISFTTTELHCCCASLVDIHPDLKVRGFPNLTI